MLQTIEEVNGTKGKLKTIFISVSHFLQFPGRDLRTITFSNILILVLCWSNWIRLNIIEVYNVVSMCTIIDALFRWVYFKICGNEKFRNCFFCTSTLLHILVVHEWMVVYKFIRRYLQFAFSEMYLRGYLKRECLITGLDYGFLFYVCIPT